MDRRLVIKGSDLVEILEDLTGNNLHMLLKSKYPCAMYYFSDGIDEYYTIFPSKELKILSPNDISEKNICIYTDLEIPFGIAFSKHTKTELDLYYLVDAVNKYIVNRGHRPKPGMKEHWEIKLRDAKSAMASWKSTQRHTKLSEDSDTYKAWMREAYEESLTEKEKEYLCVLLRFYAGIPNKILEDELNISNAKRHKRKARDIVVPKLRKLFPHLPPLPCEKDKNSVD